MNTDSQAIPSGELLARAKQGDSSAARVLLERHALTLRQWARGKLPSWARSFADTGDLVQEALMNTFRRLPAIEDRGKGALKAYLHQAVVHRIHDEVRKVQRRPTVVLDEVVFELQSTAPSQHDQLVDAEEERDYKAALASLADHERLLVVGRIELGYTYEQLALICGRPSPEAARQAVRRAVKRVAERMRRGRGPR